MLEGLPPHRPTHVLRARTNERVARALTDLLGELFDPAESAVAAFEADDGRCWLLEAYFASQPDEAAIRELIRPVLGSAMDAVEFDEVAATDWVKASLDGLQPVKVDRFVVHGAHDRSTVQAHEIGIEIEASLAFGTGHHGTTSGCLGALAAELRRRQGRRRVLDIGTGTGILAIAAARALRRRVVAGDLDPVAVEVARANARLNGVGGCVRFFVGPGLRHASAQRSRGFDVILANILARPLTRLAVSIETALATGGALILSGLLLRDVPGIVSAYRARGLALRSRSDREGWATLVLGRGGAAPRRLRLSGSRRRQVRHG